MTKIPGNNKGGNSNEHYADFLTLSFMNKNRKPKLIICGIFPEDIDLSHDIMQKFFSEKTSDQELELITREIGRHFTAHLKEDPAKPFELPYANICLPYSKNNKEETALRQVVYRAFAKINDSNPDAAISIFQDLFNLGTWDGQSSLESDALELHCTGEYWREVACLIYYRTRQTFKPLLKCILGASDTRINTFYNNIAPQQVSDSPKKGVIPMSGLCIASLITPSLFKRGAGTIYFFKNKEDIPRYSPHIKKEVRRLMSKGLSAFEEYDDSLSSFFAAINLDEKLLDAVEIRTALPSYRLTRKGFKRLKELTSKIIVPTEVKQNTSSSIEEFFSKKEAPLFKIILINLPFIKTRAQITAEITANN